MHGITVMAAAEIQNLDVISVNIWQIVISLCNLVILLLLLKKFLYKPVKKVLAQRQSAIDEQYRAAEEAKAAAEADQASWAEQMSGAREQAEEIIRSATASADYRSEQIVAQARDKADTIVRQAETQAQLELQKAEATVRQEIVDVSALLTEKLLQREIRTADHREMIDSFLSGIDDDDL